jgi:prepilin-type N-terminal cleavage/methylation domain-containing protein
LHYIDNIWHNIKANNKKFQKEIFMKNKGYTLAEVLITIGIIGILAAVLLPLINKYKPDANMAMFIKTYDTIVTATNELVSNEQLYPIKNTDEISTTALPTNYSSYPLYNTSAVTINGNTISGNSKYCNLLALSFNTTGSISCSDEYAEPHAPGDYTFAYTPSFKMTNGVELDIRTYRDDYYAANPAYKSDIYIDIDGFSKGKNCFYASKSCEQPDRFKLVVLANGQVHAADIKGDAYLKRRANWKLRKDNLGTCNSFIDYPYTFEKELFGSFKDPTSDENPTEKEPCPWYSLISADDSACKPCEYNSSLWAGSSACKEPATPCKWNSSLTADDSACKPCEYNTSIWAGSSACKEPCKWNSSISADDPACKKTTTTSSSTGTTSTDSSSNNYKGDNNNKYLSLDFNSRGYNWHPEYDMLQKTYIPGIYKNTQNNEYYVYQIDSNGKGYWGVMTAASSNVLSQKWSDKDMIEEIDAAISRRNCSSGYYYYVYDGDGASDIQDMDTSVVFEVDTSTTGGYSNTTLKYSAKDYYWGPEEQVKAFLGETYGIYD